MCETHDTQGQQRTDDEDFSRIFQLYLWGVLYVMRNAMRRWTGPRHSGYDTFDARIRSFTYWPRLLPTHPYYPKYRRILVYW